MSDTLVRIKRAVLRGDVVFTEKATVERERDGLTEEDVVESIVTAVAITKTIKSTHPRRGRRREYLHIIQSTNLEGILVYSKGKLVVEGGIDTYYVLVSAKRAL
jgi:hypothetical protein